MRDVLSFSSTYFEIITVSLVSLPFLYNFHEWERGMRKWFIYTIRKQLYFELVLEVLFSKSRPYGMSKYVYTVFFFCQDQNHLGIQLQ